MIVCVCANVNERAVQHASTMGARTPGAVFRVLGEEPQCRRCFRCMRDRLASGEGPAAGCAAGGRAGA